MVFRKGITMKKSKVPLESHWYIILYVAAIVPYIGWAVIVFLSSFMFFKWRDKYKLKAKTINTHGWLAFALHVCLSLVMNLLIAMNR